MHFAYFLQRRTNISCHWYHTKNWESILLAIYAIYILEQLLYGAYIRSYEAWTSSNLRRLSRKELVLTSRIMLWNRPFEMSSYKCEINR